MAVACNCTNPMSGTVNAYYDGTNPLACDDTGYNYFVINGTSARSYEADFVWGACSLFNLPAMVGISQVIQENGGHLNNWLQVGSGAVSDFSTSFMTPNNKTGTAFDTSITTSADSIDAAVAMWCLLQKMNTAASQCGYSGNNQILAALNSYNTGSSYSLNQAYAFSVMWKGYGSGYASHSQTTYLGAFMATGPSGTQCRANTGNALTYAALPTPGFGVPISQYYSPFGYNTNGKRTVILVGSGANEDYASGVIMEQWYYSSPYAEAFLTADSDLAAQAATSPAVCVICVGGPAVTAIQNAANYYGLSLESFSSFSAWESSPNVGYINCAGSDASQSYSLGLTAAQQAASAGWA